MMLAVTHGASPNRLDTADKEGKSKGRGTMSTQVGSRLPKLSEKNFLERAACEMRELRGEILELVEDHDIYWKVQHVIQGNARLLSARSSFLDMMNDGFAHSTALRVRRIVDTDHRTISLLRLLRDLVSYPELLGGKVEEGELENDIRELEESTKKIKEYVDQFVAHHDRAPTADTPINRELTRAIEAISRLFRKYYGALMNTDIELRISHLEDPLAIFRCSWIAPQRTPDARDDDS
jgi:hypothetical protein